MSGEVPSSMESLANGCMKKVENGELTEIEARDPMVVLQEIMKNPELMNALNTN